MYRNEQRANFVWCLHDLTSLGRPYILDGGLTLKTIIVDQLGRTLLGMRAKFCFLELQDRKLMVHSMYIVIIIGRVWRGI